MVGLRYSVIGCGLTIQRSSFKDFYYATILRLIERCKGQRFL